MRARGFMLLAAAMLFARPVSGQENTPPRMEQLIYSLLSFNGKDYSPTFCRAGEDTITLIADADSFVSIRTTLAYFWPITGEWHTDSKTLSVVHEGSLELRDRRGRVSVLQPVEYTYFNVQGRYNQNWEVALGEEAAEVWARYEESVDAYWASIAVYGVAKAAWESTYAALAMNVAKLREAGEPFQDSLRKLEGLVQPEEPVAPNQYLVPPAKVRRGFVLNLPAGVYTSRFLSPDGLEFEGSRKTIIAFSRRRSDQIGYDIIPADRWTRSQESATPASVLYVNGAADLYLRPFYQDEYNDLYYRKAVRNDAPGNPNLMVWVKIQQVENGRLSLTDSNGGVSDIYEEPYYVQQAAGSTMGYAIVPYDPEGIHPGRAPSLRGFHVPVRPGDGVSHIETYDGDGNRLDGSRRQIRVVNTDSSATLSLLLSFLPMLAFPAVLLGRRIRKGL